MHPHGVVGLDELQCLGANAAAPQVTPHGKVVQQRRPLARQHDLPRVGQPRTCVVGQQQRLVDASVQQALYLGKGFELRRREIPRQRRVVEFFARSRGQALDLHGDFSFL